MNDIGILGMKVRYLILLLYIVFGVFEVLVLGTEFRFSFTSAVFGAASLGYGVKIEAESLANELLKHAPPEEKSTSRSPARAHGAQGRREASPTRWRGLLNSLFEISHG